MDRTKPYLLTGETKIIPGCTKLRDTVRLLSSLKPVPVLPPSNGDVDSNWSKHLNPHNYRAKAPLQVYSSKPPPGWPEGIRTNPNTNPVSSPKKRKGQGNIGLHIAKIAIISKQAFDALD